MLVNGSIRVLVQFLVTTDVEPLSGLDCTDLDRLNGVGVGEEMGVRKWALLFCSARRTCLAFPPRRNQIHPRVRMRPLPPTLSPS